MSKGGEVRRLRVLDYVSVEEDSPLTGLLLVEQAQLNRSSRSARVAHPSESDI